MGQKIVRKFNFKWQADILLNHLQNANITAFILENPREYSSIITGIGNGNFSVTVSHQDYDQAVAIEQQLTRSQQLSVVEDPIHRDAPTPPHYFKRLIIYTLLSTILPFVFHIIATFAYFKSLEQNKSIKKNIFATAIIILAWSYFYFIILPHV